LKAKPNGTETQRLTPRRNRFYDTTRFGQPQIRVYHKTGRGKKMPRYLLKCGCCASKLEIYYDRYGLEIGGVNGAVEDWREILLPLLTPPDGNSHRASRRRRR
jgi:hypothetical protein